MQATLIENNGTGRMAYDSLILDNPKAFSALNSKIALKIVKALADSPASAIDVSRKLKIHEQKVYYHVRRLERAGIIYTISNEKRHGMIAKIFSVVSPVISAKLYDKGVEVKENIQLNISTTVSNFLDPFIKDGKLDGKIIIGDPSPHGTYGGIGTEGAHLTDMMLFLGRFLNSFNYPNYKLDTEIREGDLKNNLILIGNSRTNAIIDKVNSHSPIHFDLQKNAIVSKITGTSYKDDRCGLISKFTSPFNKEKKILIIGGLRTRGIRAATISIFKLLDSNFINLKDTENVHYVVQGLDKDSDMVIDDAIILE